MYTIKGQCFDCYDDATFQYIGQSGNFNSKQVQLDYVSKLKKPSTIVECVSCGRTIEYKEQDGKWKPVMRSQKMIIEKLIQRLGDEEIPTFSMTQKQLERANEILKELIEQEN